MISGIRPEKAASRPLGNRAPHFKVAGTSLHESTAAYPVRRFTSAAEFQRALCRHGDDRYRFVGAAYSRRPCSAGLSSWPYRPARESRADVAGSGFVRGVVGQDLVRGRGKPWDPRRGQAALPVRSGELVHLCLHQPAAYLYALWLDLKGQVDPLHPWARDFRTLAMAEAPHAPGLPSRAERRLADNRSQRFGAVSSGQTYAAAGEDRSGRIDRADAAVAVEKSPGAYRVAASIPASRSRRSTAPFTAA